MEFYPSEIHKLAKKYKKVFEKYFINPGGCILLTIMNFIGLTILDLKN